MQIASCAFAVLCMAFAAPSAQAEADPSQIPAGEKPRAIGARTPVDIPPAEDAQDVDSPGKKDAGTKVGTDAKRYDAYLKPEEFRTRFPAESGLEQAIAALRKANRWIDAHSRHGASAFVSLFYADGSSGYGRDYFFSGPHFRFKEIRWNYVTIADRRGGCTLERSVGAWECKPEWVPYVGIHALYPEADFAWRHLKVRCEYGRCDLWRVMQADSRVVAGRRRMTPDPEQNRISYSVILRPNGEPVMYTEQELVNGQRRGPDTSYLFDFRTRIPDFGLPRLP